jgi:hypothetical protein
MIIVVTGDRWFGRVPPENKLMEKGMTEAEAEELAERQEETVRRVLLEISEQAIGERVILRQGEAKGADHGAR